MMQIQFNFQVLLLWFRSKTLQIPFLNKLECWWTWGHLHYPPPPYTVTHTLKNLCETIKVIMSTRGMKLFFMSMLSVSRRVQIWEKNKTRLGHWLICVAALTSAPKSTCSLERAEEETCESRGSVKTCTQSKQSAWFLCLVLHPVSTSW